jgi:hypothetical protein
MFRHLLLLHGVSLLDGKNILFYNRPVDRPKASKSGFLWFASGLLPQVPGSRRLME